MQNQHIPMQQMRFNIPHHNVNNQGMLNLGNFGQQGGQCIPGQEAFLGNFNRAENRTLWMGDISPYWTEDIVKEIFNKIGIKVESIKMMNDISNGKKNGYAFVKFFSADVARNIMLELNGTPMPDIKPQVNFNFSFANSNSNSGAEFNILVSDLPPEFTDAELFKLFGSRYMGCRGAKILRNEDGSSKCMGFIRFSTEEEQTRAFIEFNQTKIGSHTMNLRLPHAGRSNNKHKPNESFQMPSFHREQSTKTNDFDRKRPFRYDKSYGLEDKRYHVAFKHTKGDVIRPLEEHDPKVMNAKMNSLDSFFVEKRLRLRFNQDYFEMIDDGINEDDNGEQNESDCHTEIEDEDKIENAESHVEEIDEESIKEESEVKEE
uniref:tRNA selenocysteine 1-associated protein 1 (inferred by orthology to a human protein) n=1 Tax=Strongyloides venezuelensis TaxID=75913 RepID=A0A0K0FVU5_STRVS